MIEIYIYASVGPLPFATFANHEWGNIGTNYGPGLAALGLQGFLIMVITGIYAVLVNTLVTIRRRPARGNLVVCRLHRAAVFQPVQVGRRGKEYSERPLKRAATMNE